MNYLSEKFWFLTAFVCLLATLSSFAIVVVSHQLSEKTTTELVDRFEEVQQNQNWRDRRVRNNQAPVIRRRIQSSECQKVACARKFFLRNCERDNFNGIGGYLIT